MLFVLITVIDYFRKNFEGLAIFHLLLILLDYYIRLFSHWLLVELSFV